MQIAIEHYQAERIPNPNPAGELPDEEFYRVRRAILGVCRRYGSTGPDDREATPSCWLVDDQPNDELYQYVEVYDRGFLSANWLRDVMSVLRDFPGWGVGVMNIRFAYLLIFANKLMVTGHPFAPCNDLESVTEAASANLWGVNGEEQRYSSERWHRETILASDRCACYLCCSVFSPHDVRDWSDVDDRGIGQTALCPICGNARVVAVNRSLDFDPNSLRQLSELAFGPFDERGYKERST
jgi:hypothetical protein